MVLSVGKPPLPPPLTQPPSASTELRQGKRIEDNVAKKKKSRVKYCSQGDYKTTIINFHHLIRWSYRKRHIFIIESNCCCVLCSILSCTSFITGNLI